MALDPACTASGRLPPWEVAKAYAFHVVVGRVADHLGMAAHECLGQRVDAFIAAQLTLQGGAHPTERAVRDAVARCSEKGWYPGQPRDDVGGRPAQITEAQKTAIATTVRLCSARRSP